CSRRRACATQRRGPERKVGGTMRLHKLSNDDIVCGYTYLSPGDCCYFLGNYSDGNPAMRPLVLALKRRISPAIRAAASLLKLHLPAEWRQECTFVPIPASRTNSPGALAVTL